MKICTKCLVGKPIEAFTNGKKPHPHCKECKSLHMQKLRRKDILKARKKDALWRGRQGPEKLKNTQLKKKFGIDIFIYNSLLTAQNNLCAICNKPETVARNGILKHLAVDHNHNTGAIRALLCQRCNQALGLLKEDFGTILSMAKYVQRTNNVN